MNKMKQIEQANKNTLIERLVDVKDNENKETWVADECEVCGNSQSDIITIEVENKHATATRKLFLGTPLSISSEAPSVANLWNGIPTVKRWDNDLASMHDQNGGGLVLFQEINKRFVRRPVLVSSIRVVTDSKAQRSVAPSIVTVPLNIEDATEKRMSYMGVDSDFNEVELLSEPVVCGDFSGIAYELLPQTKIYVTIKAEAIDSNIFKV